MMVSRKPGVFAVRMVRDEPVELIDPKVSVRPRDSRRRQPLGRGAF